MSTDVGVGNVYTLSVPVQGERHFQLRIVLTSLCCRNAFVMQRLILVIFLTNWSILEVQCCVHNSSAPNPLLSLLNPVHIVTTYLFIANFILISQLLEQVNAFNYLGCILSYVYEGEKDMPSKISKFVKAIGFISQVFKSSLTQQHTSLHFYSTLVRPVLIMEVKSGQLERQL
jgi:hypothetical protein